MNARRRLERAILRERRRGYYRGDEFTRLMRACLMAAGMAYSAFLLAKYEASGELEQMLAERYPWASAPTIGPEGARSPGTAVPGDPFDSPRSIRLTDNSE